MCDIIWVDITDASREDMQVKILGASFGELNPD